MSLELEMGSVLSFALLPSPWLETDHLLLKLCLLCLLPISSKTWTNICAMLFLEHHVTAPAPWNLISVAFFPAVGRHCTPPALAGSAFAPLA